ncbi:MAG TPA: YceI family protein [Candidatus Methylomirabilis sp.]|nr:YceI family protein [Candidatus Methylomirabilis sp.]
MFRRLPLRLAALVLALAVLAPRAPAQAQVLHFKIQPEASEITFRATSRFMNADGHFQRFGGEVVVDPAVLGGARIAITIDAASIDTGIEMRDNHLRSADFLDVARFPSITFESVRVDAAGKRASVRGRLTVHGVTREIVVPVDVQITSAALVASGEFIVNRGEYGMNYNSILNPVGNEVRAAFTFRARVP